MSSHGRARGRGALRGSLPVVGASKPPSEEQVLLSEDTTENEEEPEMQLLDIRVTEILDATTFWAQIGTAKQLEDFDQYCVSLSAQCEDNTGLPLVPRVTDVVPVRDENKRGAWVRARITRILPDRKFEVHFVDTGRCGCVSVKDICQTFPPLILQVAPQALQCYLQGVKMIEGNESLREEATSRFKKLISISSSVGLKALLHSICDQLPFLSLYMLHDGHWKSIGEMLRMESLVLYQPCGPLTIDRILQSSSEDDDVATPTGYESDVSDIELDPGIQIACNEPPVSSPTAADPNYDNVGTPTGYESDVSDIELVLPSAVPPPSDPGIQVACNDPSVSSIDNPTAAADPNYDNQVVATECDTLKSESGSEIMSDSIMLTPPPESDAVHPTPSNSDIPAPVPAGAGTDPAVDTGASTDLSVYPPAVEPQFIDNTMPPIPTDVLLSKADIDPITPIETPPSEAESPLPYSSPPPLISLSRYSKRESRSQTNTDVESGANIKDILPTLRIPLLSPKAFVTSATILGSTASLSSAPSVFEQLSAQKSLLELVEKGILERNDRKRVAVGQKDDETSDLLGGGHKVTTSTHPEEAATSSEVAEEITPHNEKVDISVTPITEAPGSPSVDNVQNELDCSTLASNSQLQSENFGSSVDRDNPKDIIGETDNDKVKCEHDVVVEEEKNDFVCGTITIEQLEKASSPTSVLGGGSGKVEEAQQSPKKETGLVSSLLADDMSDLDGGGSSDEWDESLLPPSTDPLLSADSATSSNVTTPTTTPVKCPAPPSPSTDGAKPLKKSRVKLHSQLEALMGTDGHEQDGRGKKHTRNSFGSKKQQGLRRYNNGNQNRQTEPHFWHSGFHETTRSGGQNPRGPPPTNGRGSAGKGVSVGGPSRFRGTSRGRGTHTRFQVEGSVWGEREDYGDIQILRDQSSSTYQHEKSPSFQRPGEEVWGQGERYQFDVGPKDPVPQGVPPTAKVSEQDSPGEKRIFGMSESELMNEYKWHSWKVENKIKMMLNSLTAETVGSFGSRVKVLLEDTNAKKMSSLQCGKPPLEVVLQFILSGTAAEPDKAGLFIEAIGSIVKGSGRPQVYKLLQSAISIVAQEISQGSSATDAQKRRHAFCSFLGKLFIAASYSGNEEYSMTVGYSVKNCLGVWINCSSQLSELEQVACVDCFVVLCKDIGPTIDASNKESLDFYFNGPVRAVILSNIYTRQVKELLFDLSLKRALKWNGEEPTRPLTQPVQGTTPVIPSSAPIDAHFQPVLKHHPQQLSANVTHPSPQQHPVMAQSSNITYPSPQQHPVVAQSSNITYPSPQQHPVVAPSSNVKRPSPQQHPQSSNVMYPSPQQHPQSSNVMHPSPQQHPQSSNVKRPSPQQHPVMARSSNITYPFPQQPSVMTANYPNGLNQHLPVDSSQFNSNPPSQYHSLASPTQQSASTFPINSEQQRVFTQPTVSSQTQLMPDSPRSYGPPLYSTQSPYLPQRDQLQTQQLQEQVEVLDTDQYKQILEMLQTLGFPELLSNFKHHMIMDFVLDCEPEAVKECLTSAHVPPGAVVGIMSYLENRRRKKHRTTPTTPFGFNPKSPPFQPSFQGGYQPTPGYGFYSPPSTTGNMAQEPYYGSSTGVGYSPPPAHPYGPVSQVSPFESPQIKSQPLQRAPMKVPPVVEQVMVQLPPGVDQTGNGPSSTASNSGITVRLPSSNMDWHSTNSKQPKPDPQSSEGGFGKYTCVLCRSNSHTTMICDKRDKFFVHM